MTATATRLRIRFTKCGQMRWISHRDLARVWERLLRRANLNLAFSQGFHPKPKISFPSALALGVEALDEVVELELTDATDLADIQQRIAAQLPEGMQLLSLQATSAKARMLGSSYRLSLPSELVQSTAQRIERLREQTTLTVDRDGETISCCPGDPYFSIQITGSELTFSLPVAQQGTSLRPGELLRLLGLEERLHTDGGLQRTQVHLATDAVTAPA
ncbi:MAG: TIGR03936 family radical SAM-associated protein [Pirellulaceae bacterium]|nr:TIGR03936 family radical SAM-associated protein [Pirellulaceae bacterium]